MYIFILKINENKLKEPLPFHLQSYFELSHKLTHLKEYHNLAQHKLPYRHSHSYSIDEDNKQNMRNIVI